MKTTPDSVGLVDRVQIGGGFRRRNIAPRGRSGSSESPEGASTIKCGTSAVIISVLCALALAISEHTQAADLTSAEVVHDGSVNPPGFRIDYSLHWEPSEEAATLRVAGFYLPIMGAEEPNQWLPIKSADPKYADKSGKFQASTEIRPRAHEFGGSVAVPYAALSLPVGEHHLWFQLTLLRNDRSIFVKPTGLTAVCITRHLRRLMQLEKQVAEERQSTRRSQVYIGAAQDPQLKPMTRRELSSKPTVETTTSVTHRVVTKCVDVEIPGSFEKLLFAPACCEPTAAACEPPPSLNTLWTTLKDIAPDDQRIVFFATSRTRESVERSLSKEPSAISENRIPPVPEPPPAAPDPSELSATPRAAAPKMPLDASAKKKLGLRVPYRTAGSALSSTSAEQTDSSEAGQYAPGASYGFCRVNIPVNHARSAHGFVWRILIPPDPAKDYMVESAQFLSKNDFLAAVNRGDVLLYVHGFRNSFSDAVLRAAQLRYDLEFPGMAMAFAWQSDGGLDKEEYLRVRQVGNRSIGDLAEVIKGLIQEESTRPKRRIHVIAHSLGCRVFLGALCQVFQEGILTRGQAVFGNIVLAAPDMGVLEFHERIPYAMAASERTSYYFCEHDAALSFSQGINHYEPAGRVPYLTEGLDSINANGATTSFLSHNYYAQSPLVLEDIKLLVQYGLAPNQHMPPLASKGELYGRVYWAFPGSPMPTADAH